MKGKTKEVWVFITDKLFAKVFASWFATAAVFLCFAGTASPSENSVISAPYAVLFIFAAAFVFSALCRLNSAKKGKCVPEAALCLSLLAFSCVLLSRINSMYVYIPLAVFFVLAARHYSAKRTVVPDGDMSKKMSVAFVCISAVILAHFALVISIMRYKTYSSPNYDFGIFCNMYYNMKKSFKPVSTCERDGLLSHFAVHMSPALYIFLPIYLIFPYPMTVAVCQVIAVYSGIIPFLGICKKYGVTNRALVFFTVIYASSPVLAGGCTFDFHENCLLVPFLMWMFYFYEKQKTAPMFIFAVLTLLVKEDAFVYVCVFAAFIIVSKKDYLKGFIMAVGSVAYFVFACSLLQKYGTGIMSDRFGTMIAGDEGLLGIIKTVLFNPGYSVGQILSDGEEGAGKLMYVLELFMPLAFLPFMTKKSSRLILILPIFLNLFTAYKYQYNIFFQYSFGIGACLLYLSVINAAETDGKKTERVSAVSAALSLMLFCMLIVPQCARYIDIYSENKETYRLMDEALEEIPEENSVCASAFLLPKLSSRSEIYELYYHGECDTDYLIIDIRPGYAEESLALAEKWENAGYVRVREEENALIILESPELFAE